MTFPGIGPQLRRRLRVVAERAVALGHDGAHALALDFAEMDRHVAVGLAYLAERELEQDGYGALNATVSDYLDQAQLLDDVPMAVSPLTGTRCEGLEGRRAIIAELVP